MKLMPLYSAFVLAVLAGGYLLMRPAPPAPVDGAGPVAGGAMVAVTVPELSPLAQMGGVAFANVCAACHGDNGAGRDGKGPPLVHRFYVPGHHGDEAFQIAVANGVPAHHWSFGNMPPQPGLTRADVTAIVAFVREVQRANGIQ